jgi:hypothetical protein
VLNAELFVYPGEARYFAEHDQQVAALRHRRALDFLQVLVGDEFRAARRSHTIETPGRSVVCVAESAMSAPVRRSKEEKCPSP